MSIYYDELTDSYQLLAEDYTDSWFDWTDNTPVLSTKEQNIIPFDYDELPF